MAAADRPRGASATRPARRHCEVRWADLLEEDDDEDEDAVVMGAYSPRPVPKEPESAPRIPVATTATKPSWADMFGDDSSTEDPDSGEDEEASKSNNEEDLGKEGGGWLDEPPTTAAAAGAERPRAADAGPVAGGTGPRPARDTASRGYGGDWAGPQPALGGRIGRPVP